MRNPKMHSCHQCCPEEWRRTPDMTGSFELDAMIIRTKNKDMAEKLNDHLSSDAAYQMRTAYNSSSKA